MKTPTHPGAILREDVLPSLDMTTAKFAKHIGVSRQTMHSILSEQSPVTIPMALRIAKAIGSTPNIWVFLQRNYDMHYLPIEMSDELDNIKTLRG